GLIKEHVDAIAAQGEVAVTLAGRPFRIRREFLADIAEQKLAARIADLRRALLIFHSPTDDIVGIENATAIFVAAKHPKSFVSLAGADHLLSRRSDADYVANVIAAWAGRYLDMAEPHTAAEEGVVTVRETRVGRFQQAVEVGPHRFIADEPTSVGGQDSGALGRRADGHVLEGGALLGLFVRDFEQSLHVIGIEGAARGMREGRIDVGNAQRDALALRDRSDQQDLGTDARLERKPDRAA